MADYAIWIAIWVALTVKPWMATAAAVGLFLWWLENKDE